MFSFRDMGLTLKGALSEQGLKGGTRRMTEWNEWTGVEKQELSKVMGRHGIRWRLYLVFLWQIK